MIGQVEVAATKIVFQSGEIMRCSGQTAFIVQGRSKKSRDLEHGDQLGLNVVDSVVDDGKISYFMDVGTSR
jgi:hypothetical protein